MTVAAAKGTSQWDLRFGGAWPSVLGLVVLAIPTIFSLSQQTWSRDQGAHGPIILAAAAWLLWRQIPEFKRLGHAGLAWVTWPILILSLLGYVLGRAFDFITLEAAGLYGAAIAVLYVHVGGLAMAKNWFPLLYLGFSIPPPNYLLDKITSPLKHFASFAATYATSVLGLPVAREGVTIFVGPYQLLVEDACSGMNSLIGLIAVSLLYIYLMRGSSWIYSGILLALAVPIAIAANITRIIILILLTYFCGDEVAQGFLHFTAGFILFGTALLAIFAVDRLLGRFVPALQRAVTK